MLRSVGAVAAGYLLIFAAILILFAVAIPDPLVTPGRGFMLFSLAYGFVFGILGGVRLRLDCPAFRSKTCRGHSRYWNSFAHSFNGSGRRQRAAMVPAGLYGNPHGCRFARRLAARLPTGQKLRCRSSFRRDAIVGLI